MMVHPVKTGFLGRGIMLLCPSILPTWNSSGVRYFLNLIISIPCDYVNIGNIIHQLLIISLILPENPELRRSSMSVEITGEQYSVPLPKTMFFREHMNPGEGPGEGQ
jgi:hypothetical protein